MVKVKLTTNFVMPLERQTENRGSKWGDCRFYINQDVTECDFWVVYEGLKNEEQAICTKGNTIFITAEPPAIRKYSYHFLKQFDWVITCDQSIKHTNPIFQQQGLPWHVGRCQEENGRINFTNVYDEMKSISSFLKDKEISVISSAKDITSGHRKRIAFINSIKKCFSGRIDVFGRGFHDIADKWDAIADYKYHVVIENSSFDDYWTEKLSDAFLCGAYPIYYGCPNINEYFSPDSLTSIDINNFEEAISIIKKTIIEKRYEESVEAINKARDLVLDKYNLFSMISELCGKTKSVSRKNQITLYPEKYFPESFIKGFIKSFLTSMKKYRS